MSMRRQVGFETSMPEHGFLIGFAAAVHLSPCRQVVAVGEQHTATAQNHHIMVIK